MGLNSKGLTVCCSCCWSDSRSMTELQSVLEEQWSLENELIRTGRIVVCEPDVQEHRAADAVNSNDVLEWRTKAFKDSKTLRAKKPNFYCCMCETSAMCFWGSQNVTFLSKYLTRGCEVFVSSLVLTVKWWNEKNSMICFEGDPCLFSVYAPYGSRQKGCRLIVS